MKTLFLCVQKSKFENKHLGCILVCLIQLAVKANFCAHHCLNWITLTSVLLNWFCFCHISTVDWIAPQHFSASVLWGHWLMVEGLWFVLSINQVQSSLKCLTRSAQFLITIMWCCCTVETFLTDTSTMRTPLYCGHLQNADTSMIWTVHFAPEKAENYKKKQWGYVFTRTLQHCPNFLPTLHQSCVNFVLTLCDSCINPAPASYQPCCKLLPM